MSAAGIRASFTSLFLVPFAAMVLAQSSTATGPTTGQSSDMQTWARQVLTNFPLSFEDNLGQANAETQFLARMPGYAVFLGPAQATVVFQERELKTRTGRVPRPQRNVLRDIRLKLIGANPFIKATGEDALVARSNYFIGKDPALWQTNIPTYSRVRYSSIYKGIDLVYYGNQGSLEYDFVVHPGANARTIWFAVQDSSSVELQATGDLLVRAGKSEVQLRKPMAYQIIRGQKRETTGRFRAFGRGRYGLQVGHYDPRYDLIVDPVLAYSTYLGGTDDEGIFGIAFDDERNVYFAGETSSVNFPIKNAIQPQVGGSYDAFVSKFDPTGRKLIYSTYLGGSDYDHAVGLRLDREGEVYVAGVTNSADFPVKNALQSVFGGVSDGFVAKLSASGSSLVFSTYLGGSSDDEVNAIALGRDRSVFVTGYTNSIDFPTTSGAFSTKCDGGTQPFCKGDAFVTKLDCSGQTMVYSTFIGGSSYDSAAGITLDEQGNAYIAGQTISPDFPVHNAYQPMIGGPQDAFVTKLNSAGSQTVWSTYLGGSNGDGAFDVAVDRSRNVYVIGFTQSADFPLVHPFQSVNKTTQFDGFITKFDAQGSNLLYSSYLGGSGFNLPFRIAVFHEEAAIIGFTSSTDFPLQFPLQPAYAGGNTDAFITRVSRSGDHLVFSSYLGGTGDEYGYAIAVGCDGALWVGGSTSSTDFPLAEPFQSVYGGGPFDAFLSQIKTGRHNNTGLDADSNHCGDGDCFCRK
jgi:hypothetical protein